MTVVASTLPIARGLDPRAVRMIEAVLIPVGALVASALLFSIFLLLLGKSPATFFSLIWTGGFGSSFSVQNTLQRSAPLILTGLAFAIPARIGLTLIGGGGRAGAGRLLGGGRCDPARHRRLAGIHRPAHHGAAGHAGRRGLDRARRLAAPLSRRQRDDLVAASLLHRHRHHELLRRGRAARSGLGQQALDHADRRRLPHRQRSPALPSIGGWRRGSSWR